MIKPEVEVVRFNTEDVIATSGGGNPNSVTLANFNDRIAENGTFTVGGTTYGKHEGDDHDIGNLVNALNTAAGVSGKTAADIEFRLSIDGPGLPLLYNDSIGLWILDPEGYDFNGTYTWKNGTLGYGWYK